MSFRKIATLTVLFSCIVPAFAVGPVSGQTAAGNTSTGGAVTTAAEAAAQSAQETGQSDDAANATREIAPGLRLLDSGYNADEGTAYVVVRAESTTTVRISDGGALSEGSGTIPAETRVLEAGERLRMTVPVTEVDGRVAVVIASESDAGDGLYGEVIEPSNDWFRGSPTWSETRVAGLGGFTGGVAVTMLIAHRKLEAESEEVERYL